MAPKTLASLSRFGYLEFLKDASLSDCHSLKGRAGLDARCARPMGGDL